jgi:hypothetical protein
LYYFAGLAIAARVMVHGDASAEPAEPAADQP